MGLNSRLPKFLLNGPYKPYFWLNLLLTIRRGLTKPENGWVNPDFALTGKVWYSTGHDKYIPETKSAIGPT